MQIVAHRPTQTSVVLWIQAEASETRWKVSLSSGPNDLHTWDPSCAIPHLLPNTMSHLPDTRVWMPRFDGLSPGTPYSVHFCLDANAVLAATFRTLPATLERPFVVVAASCYSEDDDLEPRAASTLLTDHDRRGAGRAVQHVLRKARRTIVTAQSALRTGPPEMVAKGSVSQAYRDFVEVEGEPHVKILTGDQVYVDAPFWHFFLPRRQGWIKKHLSGTYSRTWDKLGWLLSRGGNYFTTDDHEFWNNFPVERPWGWPALMVETFRRGWELQSREFLRWVQDPQAIARFDIGSPVEITFFLADTRMNREVVEPDGATHFMRSDDFVHLLDWVEALPAPGVLVIGQPILAREGDSVTDFNLPAHEPQYSALCSALSRAPHDVLIITGDIHYGRIAQIEVAGQDGPRRIVEVVSSPLSALLGRSGSYSSCAKDPQIFPPAEASDGAEAPAQVNYSRLAPSDDKGRSVDHFTSLRFSRSSRGAVAVRIRAHPTKGAPEDAELVAEIVLH